MDNIVKYMEHHAPGEEERNKSNGVDSLPQAICCEMLTPEETQRFAIKVRYDDGSVKKYNMPISQRKEAVVEYEGYRFTDELFAKGYLEGNFVRFPNGYSLSVDQVYLEAADFSEPEVCNEVLFANNRLRIEKKWQWIGVNIYEDEETGILKVSLPGNSSFGTWPGYATFASREGKRLTNLDFHILSDFCNGFAVVYLGEPGTDTGRYTYADRTMQFLTHEQYCWAGNFNGSIARVKKEIDGKEITAYIDRSGKEVEFQQGPNPYKRVERYRDGMARVSLMEHMEWQLAFFSEHEDEAGFWGYINEDREEVIRPQFIYAFCFDEGRAIVAKGSGWTKDPKWDNVFNTGKYWTETELWGIIDKEGNEVVPCCHDEVEYIEFCGKFSQYFQVHTGGWKKGGWGLVDRDGRWAVPPIFKKLGYSIIDGCVIFRVDDDLLDETPEGVYSLTEQKIVFAAKYGCVEIISKDIFTGEMYSEKYGKTVTVLCDRSGIPKFESRYSMLFYQEDYGLLEGLLERDEQTNEWIIEILDMNGNVIVALGKPVREIDYSAKTIICWDDGKLGMRDFDDNILIPHIYEKMERTGHGLIRVGLKDGEKIFFGFIDTEGQCILPVVYEELFLHDDLAIFAKQQGIFEYLTIYPQ